MEIKLDISEAASLFGAGICAGAGLAVAVLDKAASSENAIVQGAFNAQKKHAAIADIVIAAIPLTPLLAKGALKIGKGAVSAGEMVKDAATATCAKIKKYPKTSAFIGGTMGLGLMYANASSANQATVDQVLARAATSSKGAFTSTAAYAGKGVEAVQNGYASVATSASQLKQYVIG